MATLDKLKDENFRKTSQKLNQWSVEFVEASEVSECLIAVKRGLKKAWKSPEKGLKKGLWWGGRKFNSPPWRPASSLASSTFRSSPRSARSSTTITRSTIRSASAQDFRILELPWIILSTITVSLINSHLVWFRPMAIGYHVIFLPDMLNCQQEGGLSAEREPSCR